MMASRLRAWGGGTAPTSRLSESASPFDWTPGTRLNIVFIGDSISLGAYGGGTTEANWVANGYVGQLRQTLQARHGNGGIGFINLGRAEWVKTGSWTQRSENGPVTQAWSATGPANYWTLTVAEGDNMDLFYLNGAGYGAFEVVVDGGAPVTITPSGTVDHNHRIANISLGADGAHTVVVKAPVTGTLWLAGAAVYKGATGLVLHNIARSGSAVVDMASSDKMRPLSFLDPTIVVIGYVANDYTLQTATSTYATRHASLAATAGVYADIVVEWIPPDPNISRTIPVGVYEDIARASAPNWIDTHRTWGSYASSVGRMYDTQHPNTAGHTAIHDEFLSYFSRLGA